MWIGAFSLAFNFAGGTKLIITATDPDGHGVLGQNLAEYGVISEDIERGPTLNRGPVYPVLIAVCYFLGRENWFILLILLQSLFAAGSIILLVKICEMTIAKEIAIVASFILLFHPLFIRYPGVILLETLATFMLVLCMYSIILFVSKKDIKHALFVGLSIALAALTKATFLVFFPAFILLLGILKIENSRKIKLLAVATIGFMIILLPWTYRNYRISEKIIPVHLLGGYNMYRGDLYAKHFSQAPLSYIGLWKITSEEHDRVAALIPSTKYAWQSDIISDSLFWQASKQFHTANKGFILKKIAINSVLFWTTVRTTNKSLLIIAIRILLLFLSIIAILYLKKKRQFIALLPLLVLSIYYAAHLPLFAVGRFSAVLTPIEALYSGTGLWLLIQRFKDKKLNFVGK